MSSSAGTGDTRVRVARPALPALERYTALLEGVWERGMLSNDGPCARAVSDCHSRAAARATAEHAGPAIRAGHAVGLRLAGLSARSARGARRTAGLHRLHAGHTSAGATTQSGRAGGDAGNDRAALRCATGRGIGTRARRGTQSDSFGLPACDRPRAVVARAGAVRQRAG